MDSSTSSLPDATSLGTDLARLRDRLARARSSGSPVPNDALVQDLETAYEELRVADEEIRTQHDAITRLVESHQGLRLQHERTMAILPVPIVVTDMQGVIRSVNAAAAMLVEARVGRLLGKPVFSLFATTDRHELRRQVSTEARQGLVMRHAATLRTRTGDALAVEVAACVRFPGAGDGEISWILLAGGDRVPPRPDSVAHSLTQLAMLPQGVVTRSEVLQSAVAICHEGLGRAADVSIVLGSPLEPVDVHSSSLSAQAWDGAQVAGGEGPSESSFREGVTTTSTDLRSDHRWPRLAARLPDGDVGVIAAALKPGDQVAGTLTAYVVPGAIDLEETVELLALTLGGVLHELELRDELQRLEDEMRRALSSRAVIDQAKGIVMANRGISAEAAWEHLVHLSSVNHVKVRDVAEGIVARGSGTD
jgi:PAS domain S-box-containing protein